MDKEKLFKKELCNNIKMSVNKYNMQFKNFKGEKNFQAFVEPTTIKTKEELNEIIKDDIGKGYKYFFEWTDYKSRVKPYYDIDIWFEGHGDDWKQHIQPFQDRYFNMLSKIYPEGDIAITESHGAKFKEKTKTIKPKEGGKKLIQRTQIYGHSISFHFVVNNYECSIPELREFNEKIKIFEDPNIDKGVYRDGGNMRAIHSNKPNDSRVLIPTNFKDDLTKHVIQSNGLTNIPEVLKIPSDYSPPVSPTTSDDEKEEIIECEEVQQEETVQDEDDDMLPFEIKKIYNLDEIKKILDVCQNEDVYEYNEWLKVGMAIHNITGGDNIGFGLYDEWSKEDDGNYDGQAELRKKWKSFGKKNNGNKLGLTYLRKLYEKYKPVEETNDNLETIFKKTWTDNYAKRLQFWEDNDGDDETKPRKGMFIKKAIETMLEHMNKRLIFVKETGDYIILDKKIIMKDNGIKTTKDCWFLKTPSKTKDHFLKEIFEVCYEDEDGKKKKKRINPFKDWCEWSNRREVRAIGFDPREQPNDDIFNLWNGFNISKEEADEFNEEDAEPILEHIRKSWCNHDENAFEYVMNYLSHIIQKPHIKMGVLLALQSKEGGGKGIILDIIGRIIGDDHYCQNSNAKFLFGDFNGQLEGKILVNLDEAFWGGDKQLEGIVKNKITERRQTINKKNKENYVIDDYANYIITTNNDWFCGVNQDSRRVYCLELNNFLSGRMTQEKEDYVKKILDIPIESFAKVLYNRDISDFNARIFKKTNLLQKQVERNWNSVLSWWNEVIQEGGFNYQGSFIEWGKLWNEDDSYEDPRKSGTKIKKKGEDEKKTIYFKDWIYDSYSHYNSDTRKFQNNRFFDDLRNNCLGDLYQEKKIQINGNRRIFWIPPTLKEAREKWNELQSYDYVYEDEDDDYEIIDDF